MFKSKLFWGGVLLCSVAILFGILIHNANQPQETITIYKTVTPEQYLKSQPSDKPMVQTNNEVDKTKIVSASIDSGVSTDTEDFPSEEVQFCRDGSTNRGKTFRPLKWKPKTSLNLKRNVFLD